MNCFTSYCYCANFGSIQTGGASTDFGAVFAVSTAKTANNLITRERELGSYILCCTYTLDLSCYCMQGTSYCMSGTYVLYMSVLSGLVCRQIYICIYSNYFFAFRTDSCKLLQLVSTHENMREFFHIHSHYIFIMNKKRLQHIVRIFGYSNKNVFLSSPLCYMGAVFLHSNFNRYYFNKLNK